MAALVCEHFGFTYAGAPHAALSDVSLTIDEGAFVLIQGPMGSGKSTLLRSAHPILAPTGDRMGTMRIFNQEWDEYAAAFTPGEIAYVGQHPAEQIVCDSVWHELAFGLENQGMESGHIRQRVAEVAHYFGIESWFRQATNSLSGGQQQLVNLASVLCLRPRMLLLDEPTAQLDPVAAADFAHALFRVNRELGVTVVVATHEPWVLAPYATASYTLILTPETAHEQMSVPMPASVPVPVPVQTSLEASQLPDPFIRFSHVVASYDGGHTLVLDDFSLDIAPGTIHALVGGNGSGKTTALLVAAGALKVARGTVTNAAQAQALLPQDPRALFACDTVEDELAEWQDACAYTTDEMHAMAHALQLDEVFAQHPYDLSGGQQQTLALAKLLLARPDLLLLDEPTKGLDMHTRAQLGKALRHCTAHGCTVVIATHDTAFCDAFAHTVTRIFDGQVAQTSASADFFSDTMFFKPYPQAREALQEHSA